MSKKTFTHLAPFAHHDQQMTKATKRNRARFLEEDEAKLVREEIDEYLASNNKASSVKVSQCV